LSPTLLCSSATDGLPPNEFSVRKPRDMHHSKRWQKNIHGHYRRILGSPALLPVSANSGGNCSLYRDPGRPLLLVNFRDYLGTGKPYLWRALRPNGRLLPSSKTTPRVAAKDEGRKDFLPGRFYSDVSPPSLESSLQRSILPLVRDRNGFGEAGSRFPGTILRKEALALGTSRRSDCGGTCGLR